MFHVATKVINIFVINLNAMFLFTNYCCNFASKGTTTIKTYHSQHDKSRD